MSDPITVKLDVGFSSLDPNVLGGTLSSSRTVSFPVIRNALNIDQSSASDAMAFASVNLQAGVDRKFVSNDTCNGAFVPPVSFFFDQDTSALGDAALLADPFSIAPDNRFMNVNVANLLALDIGVDAFGTISATFRNCSISFPSRYCQHE